MPSLTTDLTFILPVIFCFNCTFCAEELLCPLPSPATCGLQTLRCTLLPATWLVADLLPLVSSDVQRYSRSWGHSCALEQSQGFNLVRGRLFSACCCQAGEHGFREGLIGQELAGAFLVLPNVCSVHAPLFPIHLVGEGLCQVLDLVALVLPEPHSSESLQVLM